MSNYAVPTEHALTAADALASLFDISGVVRLYSNDVTPNQDTVIGDLDLIADAWALPYSGSTAAPAVYNQAYMVSSNTVRVQCTSVQYNYTTAGSPDPVTVYGWVVCPGNASEIYHAGRLDEPKYLSTVNDSVPVSPYFEIKPMTSI